MKVGEARSVYGFQLRTYNEKLYSLSKQKEQLNEKIEKTENGSVIYENEAAKLELTYNAVSDKYNEYKDYMDKIMEQWNNKFNEVAGKQNAEGAKEMFKDVAKIMTVARRMMHGDIVPQQDEKKLMEYDDKLYQMAKNAQLMAQLEEKKRKKHDSLWEDEETKDMEDPMDVADDQEAFSGGPEVVSVEDTVASVSDVSVDFSE